MTAPDPETRDDRRRRLARERQARCRERKSRGDRVLIVPGSIADEIEADTDDEFSRRLVAILARSLQRDTA